MRTSYGFALTLLSSAFIALACSSEGDDTHSPASGSGGETAASGGNVSSETGGSSSGGAVSGGTSSGGTASGGAASGGTAGGGTASGGDASTGGANTGGDASTGGASTGGTQNTGGASSGGSGGTTQLGPAKVWIAGDSTVANGNTPCPVGWGKGFDALFDERITVVNSAVGGRSVRTWLYDVQSTKDASGECVLTLDANQKPVLQQRWKDMLSGMKAGDYLLIQFGINDGDSACPRHVGVEAFKQEYAMMATAAKERGAQPVFLTPVSAIACNGSTPKGTRGFVQAVIDVGKQNNVPVIDLHARSVALYTQLNFCPIPGGDVSASTTGPVGTFFCDDHTHFDTPGAAQIADLVASGLEDANVKLAEYLL